MALKARAEALWAGVITVSQIEATHPLRWYTTLLEEFDRQVGRELGCPCGDRSEPTNTVMRAGS